MINVIFCDDNIEFVNLLMSEVKGLLEKSSVKRYDELTYKCFENGFDTLKYAKAHDIGIAFLDIDMKEMNGFQIAKKLLELNEDVLIVFVSAYDQFVYDVFEFSPVSFIRKSHLADEIKNVIIRISNIIEEANSKLELNTTEGKTVIKSKEIIYINSIGNYCYVRMNDNVQYVCRTTLQNLENQLAGKGFFRTHAAFLINLNHIQRIDRNISVIMGKNQIPVPISQRRNSGFKKAYADLIRGRLL